MMRRKRSIMKSFTNNLMQNKNRLTKQKTKTHRFVKKDYKPADKPSGHRPELEPEPINLKPTTPTNSHPSTPVTSGGDKMMEKLKITIPMILKIYQYIMIHLRKKKFVKIFIQKHINY